MRPPESEQNYEQIFFSGCLSLHEQYESLDISLSVPFWQPNLAGSHGRNTVSSGRSNLLIWLPSWNCDPHYRNKSQNSGGHQIERTHGLEGRKRVTQRGEMGTRTQFPLLTWAALPRWHCQPSCSWAPERTPNLAQGPMSMGSRTGPCLLARVEE